MAFAVCTALDRIGERALLVGGSAATFYAPEAYQSQDCDFILTFGSEARDITRALETIGFSRTVHGMFAHPDIVYTVEFPIGPASIGIDLIEEYATVRREDEVLYVYTPTDVVRDRLMHYWAWGDFPALSVALDIARAQRAHIAYAAIATWVDREIAEAPAAYSTTRSNLFLNDLQSILTDAS